MGYGLVCRREADRGTDRRGLALQFLQSKSGDTPWNQLMAASTLTVLPVLVLFFLAQRTFIRGIATTGIKG